MEVERGDLRMQSVGWSVPSRRLSPAIPPLELAPPPGKLEVALALALILALSGMRVIRACARRSRMASPRRRITASVEIFGRYPLLLHAVLHHCTGITRVGVGVPFSSWSLRQR